MDNNVENTLFGVVYHSVTLVTTEGTAVNILNAVNVINIYEDIFKPTITGTISIKDATDMLATLNVHGNERLLISFSKPGQEKQKYTKSFRVYKITDRKPSRNLGQEYVIHFCSEEQIFSNEVIINRIFKGGTTTDYVKSICSGDLKINPNKMVEFENSGLVQEMIISKLTPFEAIDVFTKNSINSVGSPFLFFENSYGYNFQSIASMFTSSSVVKLNFSTAKRTEEQADLIPLNFNEISFFNVTKMFDIWQNTRELTYSGRLYTLDLLRQKYKFNDYSLFNVNPKNFADAEGGGFPFNNAPNRNNKALYQTYDSNIRYSITNKDQSKAPYLLDRAFRVTDTNVEQTLMQRESLMNMLKNTIIDECEVAGNPAFTVGMCVEIDMPAFTSNSESTRNLDPFLSGKYLIARVRHVLTKGVMRTYLSLVKNSYSSTIRPISTLSPDLVKVRDL